MVAWGPACKRDRGKDGELGYEKRLGQDTEKTSSAQLKILVQVDDLSSALVYTLGNHQRRQPRPNVRRPAPFIRALAHQEVFRQRNTATLASEIPSPCLYFRQYLPRAISNCKHSAVLQERSPSAVANPSNWRHSEAESVTSSTSRRKPCSQCRDGKLKFDLGNACSK
ncbi:BZ3500_MvSof-1268-A1-R1_Chr1-3g01605 [Microbotryum saponariae]|uniref:BZ3500_MvSof-1268-A1-R1_Chr1-3g01605 protein n=1 Tax=Microbotryum saponariae TaxID=289078 RepID=A0A2X0K9I2_9BASI|nr:BZ3500_MvSof-1268-A1-R1_Chr1-3g01605 [Microbotryum saponariae]SCZ94122.1 BZ3501_MvSof-1269-A2-R1_Chr1-3g01206 [Microbotryum saponariae]